tara:strand:- start:17 stop:190 length:174 start_codon:yes stop_codon:yes gene_type:complete
MNNSTAQDDIVMMWGTLKDMSDQAQRYREDTLERISFLARVVAELREEVKQLKGVNK